MFRNSLEVVTVQLHMLQPSLWVRIQVYSSLLSIRDEETSFQNGDGTETYNVSNVKEKAECESDRGQSHPSIV